MTLHPGRLEAAAAVAAGAGAFFVLLLYAPALQAPFLVPKFAALDLAASVGAALFVVRRAMGGGPRWSAPVLAGAAAVVLTTAVAWAVAAGRPLGAPYAAVAMGRWGALLGVACGVSLVQDRPAQRQRVLEAVTLSAAMVSAIGLLQHLGALPLSIPIISVPGSTFGNRNLAAEATAMALPLGIGAAAGASRSDSRAFIGGSVVLQVLYLAVTRARSAWVGAAVGVAAALMMARFRPSRAWKIAAPVLLVAGCIAASLPGRYNPRDAGDLKRYSSIVDVLENGVDARSTAVRTRLGLWRRTLAMTRDYPVWGVGPGNWPVLFPRYAEPGATRDGVLSASLAPRQAHDDVLERAAETGIVGLGAFVALIAGVVVTVRRRLRAQGGEGRWGTAAAAGSLLALATMWIASFPLEMPGTLFLSGVALGLVVTGPRSEPAGAAFGPGERAATAAGVRGVRVAAAALLGTAAVVAMGVRAEICVRASYWLGAAEHAMRRGEEPRDMATALAAVDRSLALVPDDFRARQRLSQVLLWSGRAAESEAAARRLCDLEPYCPVGWATVAAAELAAGDADAARRDAERALALLNDYPVALGVHAQAVERCGDMAAAQRDRDRLAALAAGPPGDANARRARSLLESR